MSRPALRRNLVLESLESREVMAAGGPSAQAQYMLELLNAARTNPQGMADQITSNLDANVQATIKYYGVDLNAVKSDIANSSPRPPLAWSDQLAGAAAGQSQDQSNTGVQSHTGADGSNLGQRLDRAGYTGRASDGENAYAYSQSVDHAMEAFLIDWGVAGSGHRKNILQPDASPDQYYREAGIGIVDTNKMNIGPKVITIDFARKANSLPYILGVAYNDKNGDHRYGLGEGQGNVQVTATNVNTGESQSVLTWDQGGGYQMQVKPGTYDVTATVNGRVVNTNRVSVGDQNVQVDYNLSDPWQDTTPVNTPPAVVAAPQPQPQAQPQPQNLTPVWLAPTQGNQVSNTVSAPSRSAALRSAANWMSSWSSWTARRFG